MAAGEIDKLIESIALHSVQRFRDLSPVADIAITPEMIAAGLDALNESGVVYNPTPTNRWVVVDILRAVFGLRVCF